MPHSVGVDLAEKLGLSTTASLQARGTLPSFLGNTDTTFWITSAGSLMVKQAVTAMGGDSDLDKVIAAGIEQNYVDELY